MHAKKGARRSEFDEGVPVGDGSLWISNHSSLAKRAAAWKFIQYLESPAVMAEWAAGPGYVPRFVGQRYDYAAALQHMANAGYAYDPATGRGGSRCAMVCASRFGACRWA